MIYVRSVGTKNYTERTLWYRKHIRQIKVALLVTISVALTVAVAILYRYISFFSPVTTWQLLLLTSFPAVAAWYTSVPKIFRLVKIRQVGWIKPFVVGLTWAGWVTVYPVIFSQLQTGPRLPFNTTVLWLLGLQNFLFFSLNAIIFDLKDYRADTWHQLNTLPVLLGVRQTIRYVIVPLLIINLAIFFLFQKMQEFNLTQVAIQLIPYILLANVIGKYRHGRGVLYYLAAVDGLVFLKAFCGIASVLLIKK